MNPMSKSVIKERSKSLILDDWRNYFMGTELDNAFKDIEVGNDPEEEEKLSASDSNASDDNLEVA